MRVQIMNNFSDKTFSIKKSDVMWSLKLFAMAIGFACLLGFSLYLIMNSFTGPETVNKAITTTSSTATKKVEVSAKYISPVWSIFIFNTIAAFTAAAGTGLFVYIHHALLGDLEHRFKNKKYSTFSIKTEQLFRFFSNKIYKLTTKTNKSYKQNGYRPISEYTQDSIWYYSGFSEYDYQKIAQLLPYTIPVIIIFVNGILIGLLFSYFIFNGIIDGYEVMGLKGIMFGGLYSFSYFISSILPHGILELPALLLTASMGHRFAKIQSCTVKNKSLFRVNSIASIYQSLEQVNLTTKTYLKSKPLWILLTSITVVLFAAAYIEINITPVFVKIVMDILDDIILSIK